MNVKYIGKHSQVDILSFLPYIKRQMTMCSGPFYLVYYRIFWFKIG